MLENVKQHAVPQFYLRQFTDANGKVHALRLKQGVSYLSSPAGVAFERDCFTIFADHARDLSCDMINNKFEVHCAPLIGSLRPDVRPTVQQFQAVWMLAANLYTRSRRVRDETREMVDRAASMIEEMVPILRDNPLPGAIAEMCSIGDDMRAILREAEKLIYPIALLAPEIPAESLAVKPCKILVASSDMNFVTSDDPVVVVAGGRGVRRSRGSDLLPSDNVEVYFPLSPRLACHWGPGHELDWFPVPQSEVEYINRLVAESVYRELYACRSEDLEPFKSAG